LSLSLKQLLELALESFELVKSASEFFCIAGDAATRRIVIVVIITVLAAATRAAGSIIAVAIIIVVARITATIIFFIAVPLDHAEPSVRHNGGLALVISATECVPCKIEEHFLEVGIADSRTHDLSHNFFRRLNVVVSYRVPTSSPTGRRIAHAGDGHFIGVH
jgi:hypothetical protein